MYVTDLDKTLLRSDLSLSPSTISIINSLIDAGVLFTYATARAPSKARSLLQSLRLNLPAIVYNGALIVDPTDAILLANTLDASLVEDILEKAGKAGLRPFILGREGREDVFLYGDYQNGGQRYFVEQRLGDKRMRYTSELTPVEETILVNFISGEEPLRAFREELQVSYGEEIELKLAPDPYCVGYYSLEVLHAKADKAIALRQLAEIVGIGLEDITVFGDHLNDLVMFEVAGKAIAVGNAQEEVKARASLVIDLNDEDGVARFLMQKHPR